jgi:hypothetical protein
MDVGSTPNPNLHSLRVGPAGAVRARVSSCARGDIIDAECAVADLEVAGEAGSPAPLEDRLVQVLDVAVCQRSAGTDALMADVALRDQLVETRAKLVAVIGDDAFELPVAAGEVSCDAAGERAGVSGG